MSHPLYETLHTQTYTTKISKMLEQKEELK